MKGIMKSFGLVSLVFLTLVFSCGLYAQESEEVPVKVTFTNNSSHAVQVNVIAYDVVNAANVLDAGATLELDVPYGHGVRLEYLPNPKVTELSQMGMWNELFRTISIRDDGEGIFVNESFSGARKNPPTKAAHRKRADGGVAVSDPAIGRVNRPGRKSDTGVSDDKMPVDKHVLDAAGLRAPAPKKKRREDPTKPAPKAAVDKSKVKDKVLKDKELKEKKEKQ